ncbi:MAG: hypothetical protein F4146_02145 [Rhodothermaceae bacterium]|nr:hypothetical protein [Rhodothermaceae bacterium]MYH07364.1 hypothetical protein [Rhodothermaceae bacterium]
MKCQYGVDGNLSLHTDYAVTERHGRPLVHYQGQLIPSAESDRSGSGVSARLPIVLDQYGFTQKDMGFFIDIKTNVCGLAEGGTANKSTKETGGYPGVLSS